MSGAPHPLLALVSGYELWVRQVSHPYWEQRLSAVLSRVERTYGRHVAETVLVGLRTRLRVATENLPGSDAPERRRSGQG